MTFYFRLFVYICSIFFYLNKSQAYTLVGNKRIPKSISQIKSLTSTYKKDFLLKNLQDFLIATRPGRLVGTSGHLKSIPFLIDKIKKISPDGDYSLTIDKFTPNLEKAVKMYQQDFKNQVQSKLTPDHPEYQKWKLFTDGMVSFIRSLKGVEGRNLIWEKKGIISPDEMIIIGAHFDTITHNPLTNQITPSQASLGADDNGTGVATALSLIEVLSEVDLAKTVRVVFFDFQQIGFLGSDAFLKKYSSELKSKKLYSYFQLVMLGHDSKAKDKTKKLRNFKIYTRSKSNSGNKEIKIANQVSYHAKRIGGIDFDVLSNNFNNCDHVNFWEQGIPAIVFTQDWENDLNPRYHTKDDFAETLNYKSFYSSFKGIVGAVIAWNFDILK